MKKKIISVILVILVVIGCFALLNLFSDGETLRIINKDKKYDEYKAGDKVDFYDDSWFVLYDSGKNEEYVTLISSKIDYYVEAPEVIDGIYETSELKKYFDEYLIKEYGEDNLVEKNGYKVRLFNEDDMRMLLDVKYNSKDDSYTINNCPDYICLNHTFFATMIDTDNSFEKTDVYNNKEDIGDEEEYSLHMNYYYIVGEEDKYSLESVVNDTTMFVRPVINVYKESLIEQDPYHYEMFGE